MSQDIKDMKLNWVPSKKELDEFSKERLNIYKGTYVVCLVYGLCALFILLAGAFTDWGREYIYGKLLPATATFVFGALFIVLYLAMAIYDLKPKQYRTKQDADNGILCPDYWKLEVSSGDERKALKEQANGDAMTSVYKFNIDNESDPRIQYKCKMDTNVYDTLKTVRDGDLSSRYKIGYNQTNVNRNENNANYVYVEPDAAGTVNKLYNNNGDLANKYAKLVSIDSATSEKYGQLVDANNAVIYTTGTTALKCNEVYPRILEEMDQNTPEKNKYRCEYAKACDITWTDLGCKYDMRTTP